MSGALMERSSSHTFHYARA